jgi:hypothetical protein
VSHEEAMAAIRRQMEADTRAVHAEILRDVPMWSANDLESAARASDISTHTGWIEALVAERQIFCIESSGMVLYPAFQFTPDGRPKPLVAEILKLLMPIYSPWDVACWFWGSTGWLGGRSPFEVMDSAPALVLHAAEQELPDY